MFSFTLNEPISLPNGVHSWTLAWLTFLWAHTSNLVITCHFVLVFIANYKPCHLQLKYRCPIKQCHDHRYKAHIGHAALLWAQLPTPHKCYSNWIGLEVVSSNWQFQIAKIVISIASNPELRCEVTRNQNGDSLSLSLLSDHIDHLNRVNLWTWISWCLLSTYHSDLIVTQVILVSILSFVHGHFLWYVSGVWFCVHLRVDTKKTFVRRSDYMLKICCLRILCLAMDKIFIWALSLIWNWQSSRTDCVICILREVGAELKKSIKGMLKVDVCHSVTHLSLTLCIK